MKRAIWAKVLGCLVDLEFLLPKDGHLRVRGLECCDELVLGWARKKKKWHAGRGDKACMKECQKGCKQAGRRSETFQIIR